MHLNILGEWRWLGVIPPTKGEPGLCVGKKSLKRLVKVTVVSPAEVVTALLFPAPGERIFSPVTMAG